MKLDQKGHIIAEYIWIDAHGATRSKSRVSIPVPLPDLHLSELVAINSALVAVRSRHVLACRVPPFGRFPACITPGRQKPGLV